MVPDLAHLRFDQVKVVEQPFGGGRDRLTAPHITGEESIRVTEHAGVIRQAA